jgi:DHA3 family multidrug efflux protein-like MFS transporter
MADTTKGTETTFRRLLANTLVTGVTSTFLWFSLTFWVFLETHSVVATGVIAGTFTISSALLGPVFGTFVDRHRKHTAMLAATAVAALCFAVATAVYASADSGELLRLTNVRFWMLIAATLLGSVAAQLRGIPLSTCVTLLVPEDRRDRANGMVGTVTGLSSRSPRCSAASSSAAWAWAGATSSPSDSWPSRWLTSRRSGSPKPCPRRSPATASPWWTCGARSTPSAPSPDCWCSCS